MADQVNEEERGAHPASRRITQSEGREARRVTSPTDEAQATEWTWKGDGTPGRRHGAGDGWMHTHPDGSRWVHPEKSCPVTDEARRPAIHRSEERLTASPDALAALEHLFFIIERLDRTQGSEPSPDHNVTVTLETWRMMVSPAVAVVRRALDAATPLEKGGPR